MAQICFFENTILFEESACLGFIFQENMSRQEYLEALRAAFHFPDYFGFNWDALFECLCDLDWEPVCNRKCCLIIYKLPAEEQDCRVLTHLLQQPEIKLCKIFIHSSLRERWDNAEKAFSV